MVWSTILRIDWATEWGELTRSH